MKNPYAGRSCFFVSDAKEKRLWGKSFPPALSCAGKCEAGAACVRSWRTEPCKMPALRLWVFGPVSRRENGCSHPASGLWRGSCGSLQSVGPYPRSGLRLFSGKKGRGFENLRESRLQSGCFCAIILILERRPEGGDGSVHDAVCVSEKEEIG